MKASQVVVYFDKPEDALRFTMAASLLMSEDNSAGIQEAVARGLNKAHRITTECTLGVQTAVAQEIHTKQEVPTNGVAVA